MITYLNLRSSNILHPNLDSDAIEELAFGNLPIPNQLSIEDIVGCSLEIKDVTLSPCEVTVFLNIASLLNKVSIINVNLSVIRDRLFMIFLNFSETKVTHLYLEDIEFEVFEKSEFYQTNEEWRRNLIMNEYDLNLNSYWLFYILKHFNLLRSLEEIHIKQEDSSFWLDLFKLVSKYWTEIWLKRCKIFYFDSELESETELNDEACIIMQIKLKALKQKIAEENVYFLKEMKEIGMHEKVFVVLYLKS